MGDGLSEVVGVGEAEGVGVTTASGDVEPHAASVAVSVTVSSATVKDRAAGTMDAGTFPRITA